MFSEFCEGNNENSNFLLSVFPSYNPEIIDQNKNKVAFFVISFETIDFNKNVLRNQGGP